MKEYSFSDLIDVMKKLRGENGCPWDKEQSYSSLLKFLIEESHEYIEAVFKNDKAEMAEELGDVLLQVVFHAQIASELNDFDITDVISGITSKMIRRHPHVFSDKKINSSDEVLVEWDKIKKTEKPQKEKKSALDGVVPQLPALSYAAELQKKAGKVGFDWPDIKGPISKIKEEMLEVEEAIAEKQLEDVEEEIGDLLFSVVNLSRKLGLDGEIALKRANMKFTDRFYKVENEALKNPSKNLKDYSLEELDVLWNKIKK